MHSWCFDFTTSRWTHLGPRESNFDADYVIDPADAIVFPGDLAPVRFSAVALSFGKVPALYIFGGAGGNDMMTELEDLWKFNFNQKKWELLDSSAGIPRYDAAGALVDSHLLIFGGHGKGNFYNDLHYHFIGEEGF